MQTQIFFRSRVTFLQSVSQVTWNLFLQCLLPVFFWVWLVGPETWYQEFVKNSNFVWVFLISDSIFQNNLSMSSMTASVNFFLLQSIFQYSSSKKKSWHRKTLWPQKPKFGRSLFVPENQWCFSQKKVAAFQSKTYYPSNLSLLFANLNVICSICFLKSQQYCSNGVKKSTRLWIDSMVQYNS